MKLCRFIQRPDVTPRVGFVGEPEVLLDLTSVGSGELSSILQSPDPAAVVEELLGRKPPRVSASGCVFLAPVDRQEVWAAGVTYLRSKTARMEESEFSASAYDRVYDAPRPEIFFKSMPGKVVGPDGRVGIRRDAKWNVPEPELVLVLNSCGKVVGYTVGNDMSSRDIEGENLLYLPQAKMYRGSCSIGPCITLADEATARSWSIQVKIERGGKTVFSGETGVSQIKRRFDELAEWLFRSQEFPDGAMLFTGTGVVPPDSFTLNAGDRVTIEISGIGRLVNDVMVV